MSGRFEKAFVDVATDMVGGETPPEWLTRALMELARSVATIGFTEEGDPFCKEVRSRFRRVQAAASKMDRALDGIRDGLLWMTGKDIEALTKTVLSARPYREGMLPNAICALSCCVLNANQ